MIDIVRRFITRLSPDGCACLFQHVQLATLDVFGLRPREREKRLIAAVASAQDQTRGRIEGISGHVVALVEKGDFAERALREVCGDRAALWEILESDKSLEERIFYLWLHDSKLLDRARNRAMSMHWRDGRFHCGFTVMHPQPVGSDIAETLNVIRRIVQDAQGGRKVSADMFTYVGDDEFGQLIHHIAIYLETPASFLMEFQDGENAPIPVLRREAREIAVDYNTQTGRLDVAGKGIGGYKVFQQLAKAFGATALAGAEVTEIIRDEWQLHSFLGGQPTNLSPPDGYAAVRVTEMVLYSKRSPGGKVSARAGENQSVYDRLSELGISNNGLLFETLHAVTLTIDALPEADEECGREVRVTLSGPNARSFEWASIRDRKVVEAWLQQPPFLSPK